MALFVGEFDQSVDEKRRLAISSALREQIDPAADGDGFYLLLGPDRHLWLYPDQYYRRLTATLKRSPLPTRAGRKLELFYAMARHLKPDAQGRVVLPEKSVQRALISEEVTLVGQDDHIEIWPRRQWEEYFEEHFPTYGEGLYELGDRLAGGSTDPGPTPAS